MGRPKGKAWLRVLHWEFYRRFGRLESKTTIGFPRSYVSNSWPNLPMIPPLNSLIQPATQRRFELWLVTVNRSSRFKCWITVSVMRQHRVRRTPSTRLLRDIFDAGGSPLLRGALRELDAQERLIHVPWKTKPRQCPCPTTLRRRGLASCLNGLDSILHPPVTALNRVVIAIRYSDSFGSESSFNRFGFRR